MKFDIFTARIDLLGNRFLAGLIEIPWKGEEQLIPLRFHSLSRIELRRGGSLEVIDLPWLIELMKRVDLEQAVIRQLNGDCLFSTIFLSGELIAKGSGPDIDLAMSSGKYFNVTRMLVEDSREAFFQHERGPRHIEAWTYLRDAIDASYEKVRVWERDHRKGIVCA